MNLHIASFFGGADTVNRVLDAGLRPFSPRDSPGGVTAGGCGYGQGLDYDSFVCFYLCEEALRAGTCSARDVKYCFRVVDEGAQGRLGMAGFDRYLEDAVRAMELGLYIFFHRRPCDVCGIIASVGVAKSPLVYFWWCTLLLLVG